MCTKIIKKTIPNAFLDCKHWIFLLYYNIFAKLQDPFKLYLSLSLTRHT